MLRETKRIAKTNHLRIMDCGRVSANRQSLPNNETFLCWDDLFRSEGFNKDRVTILVVHNLGKAKERAIDSSYVGHAR
jgi:hypothetical protein